MKIKVDNYIFNKTAKTVQLTDFESIDIANLLLITNVTDGIIIYAFDDPAKLGIASGNTVTLGYDTSAMSDSDSLQIWYQDSETEGTKAMQLELLNRLAGLNVLELAQTAIGEIKVTIGATSVIPTVTTVSTVTTVTSLTNQVSIGSNAANTIVFDSMNLGAILGNINNIT